MTSPIVIIQASARKGGDTHHVIRFLRQHCDWDALDLLDYNIGPYDYQCRNRQDDFLELMEHLVGDYQKMVFATPVYWYAMSGLLKNFFDRTTST